LARNLGDFGGSTGCIYSSAIAVTNHSGLTTASTANAKGNRSGIDDRSQLSNVSDKKIVNLPLR
jgi:hypothetical protein